MFLVISLLALSLFFSIYLFMGLLLLLSGGWFLAYKRPELYKNKLASYLPNIFVVLLSFFFIVVFLEIYLHLAQPAFLEAKSPLLGELSDYQSQGYVTDKTFTKTEGSFRILGLGDSFALCGGDKNYHSVLTAALKAAGHNHIDLVNAGQSAIGPGYYWRILEKFGPLWKPDLVLVGFFVGNDFGEMDFFVLRGPFIKEPSEPLKRWLGYLKFHNFWLYKVVKGKLTLILEKRRKEREKEEAEVQPEGFLSNQAFLDMQRSRMRIFQKETKAGLERLWQEKGPLLLKFKEWCAQRNVSLVIAIFPDQFQVDPDLRQVIYNKYQIDASTIDLSFPNRLISDYCRQNGILCLDLLEPFQEQGAARNLYLVRDSHWSDDGNRLAGEQIFNFLMAHRLIKTRQGYAAGGLFR
jgi:hypothetical protein